MGKIHKSKGFIIHLFKDNQTIQQIFIPQNYIYWSKYTVDNKDVFIQTVFLNDHYQPITTIEDGK